MAEKVNCTDKLHVSNSIVIGLGGLGTTSLAYYKSKLSDYFDFSNFHGCRLMAIDTALPDVATCPEIASIRNNFYQLICPADHQRIIDNPESYPDIMSILPDNVDYSVLKEAISSEEGATWRSFSQIILRSSNNPQNIYDQVNDLFSKPNNVKNINNESVEFKESPLKVYIVGSIYGGTCSGTFIDIAGMVRNIAQFKRMNTQIIGIFFLPGFNHNPTQRWGGGAYAALKEIEYYLSGNNYKVSYPGGINFNLENTDASNRLFNTIFLVDEKIGNTRILDRNGMADAAAEFLYFLTVTEAGIEIYNRYQDTVMEDLFNTLYPMPTSDERKNQIQKDRRKTIYSAFNVQTLVIPLINLKKYITQKYAYEIFSSLQDSYRDINSSERTQNLLMGGPRDVGLIPSLQLSKKSLIANFLFSTNIINTISSKDKIKSLGFGINSISRYIKAWQTQIKNQYKLLTKKLISSGSLKGGLEIEIDLIIGRDGYYIADDVCGKLISDLNNLRMEIETEASRLAVSYNDESLKEIIKSSKEQINNIKEIVGYGKGSKFIQLFKGYLKRIGMISLPAQLSLQIDTIANTINEYLNNLAQVYIDQHILALLDEIITEVRRVKKEVVEHIDRRMSSIGDSLRSGLNIAASELEESTYVKNRIKINNFEERFYTKFLRNIPENYHPENCAAEIKNAGLNIESEIVRVDQFGSFSDDQIANAFKNLASSNIRLNDNHLRDLWQMTFDNEFFNTTEPAPNDFTVIAEQFAKHSEPFLNFDLSDINPTVMNRVISGSLCSEAGTNWRQFLGTKFSGIEIEKGMYGNQVTLLRFFFGIPAMKLTKFEDWYGNYLQCISQSRPIHIRKGIIYAPEPYIDVKYKPDAYTDQLIALLQDNEIIKDNGNNHFTYNVDPHLFRNEYIDKFWDSDRNNRKYINANELKKLIERNYIFRKEIEEKLASVLADKLVRGLLHLSDYKSKYTTAGYESEQLVWLDYFKKLEKKINKHLEYMK